MKASIVVGNPKPQSRTRAVAESLVQKLVTPPCDLEVIELADHTQEVFAWPSETMAALDARVAESDLVVLASPTYKATYTGLLKAFLDRYPANGLAGVTAIPVLTGADLTHSMGADVHLAPLLMELGATVPGRGLYFVMSCMDQLEKITEEAADRYAAVIGRTARLYEGVRQI
ncbi:NADPH-dependent FMN reductase [Pseudonocardia sp. CNS-004]|nr:NADPH-dependent FMN reductase [Pseudonocardia sp. CNS-004]